MKTLIQFRAREIIEKCGLDAYFFLRYLRTMLIVFIPICLVVIPILIPLNYVDGKGQDIENAHYDPNGLSTASSSSSTALGQESKPIGLDTLSWGNIRPDHTKRYIVHLIMGLLVIIWTCTVFFLELKVYIKVRQDYLTSAQHRLRASATTVLVNSIPEKWLSEEALAGLFDVFPGGVRNIWVNKDMTVLLDKINTREKVHKMLESAETDLIRNAKRAQLKMKEAEEKKRRKKLRLNPLSRKEKAHREAQQDAQAREMAECGDGMAAGNHDEIPHTVAEGMQEARDIENNLDVDEDASKGSPQRSKYRNVLRLGDPINRVGHGVWNVVNKAGQGVDQTLEATNGFAGMALPYEQVAGQRDAAARRRANLSRGGESAPAPSATETSDHAPSALAANSARYTHRKDAPSESYGNTVRETGDDDDMYSKEVVKFWQFWKPPAGSYASPIPQGAAAADYRAKKAQEKKSTSDRFKRFIPFAGGEEIEPLAYPKAYNDLDQSEGQSSPEWARYLKEKERPTHHLPLFGVSLLPGIPFVTKKVDTINWCREELARLNVEIEEDQRHPERYPLMNSAFIQFNHQVAAHMACQSIIHHVPKGMSPRMLEISPHDIIWGNMALPWWEEWIRFVIMTTIVCGMVFLWAIPVAWTAALSQFSNLVQDNSWLSFLDKSHAVESAITAISGVLPATVLSILLYLVPFVLSLFASFKGAKTGVQKNEFVQIFFFIFLFVQVFLIVSVASFFTASLNTLVGNISQLNSVGAVLNLLATNLPKAANYFFSYMILQALSTSSGTLLQIGPLIFWFIIARINDSTARQKWHRNLNLNTVRWGKFFPIYTNFACIGLIYSVIAPLISIFAVITFSLLWLAQRYAMIYIYRSQTDTSGILYPRAINQTFTGLYFMELCMAGLFFIVQDTQGKHSCTTEGIIMIVSFFLTIIYQFLLNYIFAPLCRYLPITFEDEAVLRDEAFKRAQEHRLLVLPEEETEEDGTDASSSDKGEKPPAGVDGDDSIEMRRLDDTQGSSRMPINAVRRVGTWARGGGQQIRKITLTDDRAALHRRQKRQKDLEAQHAIGDALFGGITDDIEDLTPQERDSLTQRAFLHSALRARRPTVWIPRDDLGVSDDEVRRTRAYSDHIWISNEGTALDSKCRVVYGRNPPDFSELELISL